MGKQKQSPKASHEQHNSDLVKTLEEILDADQTLRKQLNTIQNDEEKKQLWDRIEALDAINLKKIESIFTIHGYPGKSKVGEVLSSVGFLVIQHAPLAMQEKYFPLLEQAAKEGEIRMSHLALLIDRIHMYKGEKQIYGSQITAGEDGTRRVYDIQDEINVNKRRQEVGLMPLEEYAKQFGIKYVYTSK